MVNRTKQYIVALDIGTTSIRAVCYNRAGKVVAIAQKEIAQFFPHPGWVEQDATELWKTSESVLSSVLQGREADVAAIGITNQRETTIVWDVRTGKPVYNAIVWQCRRTADQCEKLQRRGKEDMVRRTTGLRLDPYFSASKIQWILQHTRTPKQHLKFGTVDSWIIWNLTQGQVHATDESNASRTLLFDIHKKQWSKKLCELFGIPMNMLPQVKHSIDDFGSYKGIPIRSVVGDQQAALFAQGGWKPGKTKVTYGTGLFLMQNTGDRCVVSKSHLLTTLTPDSAGKSTYALEGSVFVGGAVMQWLRDSLQILPDVSQSQRIAESVPDTNGATIVPAFTGLGAPHWNPHVHGILTGITRGTTWKHLVRTCTESMAFQVHDVITAMQKDSRKPIREIVVDGGAARDNFLLQFQADISRCRVTRGTNHELTALGAAMLAGLGVGFWKDSHELSALVKEDKTFFPKMAKNLQKANIYRWDTAVGQVLASDLTKNG